MVYISRYQNISPSSFQNKAVLETWYYDASLLEYRNQSLIPDYQTAPNFHPPIFAWSYWPDKSVPASPSLLLVVGLKINSSVGRESKKSRREERGRRCSCAQQLRTDLALVSRAVRERERARHTQLLQSLALFGIRSKVIPSLSTCFFFSLPKIRFQRPPPKGRWGSWRAFEVLPGERWRRRV